jgi:hypothetical protein
LFFSGEVTTSTVKGEGYAVTKNFLRQGKGERGAERPSKRDDFIYGGSIFRLLAGTDRKFRLTDG